MPFFLLQKIKAQFYEADERVQNNAECLALMRDPWFIAWKPWTMEHN